MVHSEGIPLSTTRQQLSQREIDGVLASYEIGAVHSITELAAGSLYSPKIIIESDRGKLLLKRRARGLDLPTVVAFSHEVILGCSARGLCVPPLLGTRENNNSMTQFQDHIYELFVYIEGETYNHSPALIQSHARQAGELLAETHRVLDTIETSFEPSVEPVAINLDRINLLSSLNTSLDPQAVQRLGKLLEYGSELIEANDRARLLVHGDWHPGNMIFSGPEIIAVCDFDNARIGSRVREIAQALIHFSMKLPKAGEPASRCAPEPDLEALAAFWSGYRSMKDGATNVRTVIGLMPAVMIDAVLASLAAQDTNPSQGASPNLIDAQLVAIARKAFWIDEHQSDLVARLDQ